jgi:hypothetical protein
MRRKTQKDKNEPNCGNNPMKAKGISSTKPAKRKNEANSGVWRYGRFS